LFSLAEISSDVLWQLTARACELSKAPIVDDGPLTGQIIGLLFTKPSTRTRTAFTVGTLRLGGSPIAYGPGDLQTSTGESIRDTGRVLGMTLDALVARTAGPLDDMRELARAGDLVVINAMAAEEHPTQAICDLATLRLRMGQLDGLRFLYVGEGNNTATALAYALTLVPRATLTFATPPGYGLPVRARRVARGRAERVGATLREVHEMEELPGDVDVVYTTRWQTTGTVKPDPAWRETFRPFSVDETLLRRWPNALLMHDLPAHRGEEVSAAALEGSRSIAWTQAGMKLPSAMAVLERFCRGRRPFAAS
jgi:ornithine carbamoyltransferase/carbamoyltransferase